MPSTAARGAEYMTRARTARRGAARPGDCGGPRSRVRGRLRRARRSPGSSGRPRDATARRARSGWSRQLDRLGQLVERARRALTRSPSPSRSTPWWWCDLVAVRGSPDRRASASEPVEQLTSWSAPSNVPITRRCSSWPRRSGRCWSSVPPQRDVDQLHAAADPEHRQVALDRRAHQRDLEGVALGHRVDGLRRARARRSTPGRCRRRRRASSPSSSSSDLARGPRRAARPAAASAPARRRAGPRRRSCAAAAPPAGPRRSSAPARAPCRCRSRVVPSLTP